MKITDLLKKNGIALNPNVKTKEEAINKLVDLMNDTGRLNDKEAYKEAVLPISYAEGFLKLLNPVCPHITEELWNLLGHHTSIAYETWPTFDESKLIENTIEIPVQINGKLKATVTVPLDCDQVVAQEIVHANDTITELLKEKNVVKEIYVKNKIYNLVVR